MTRSKHAQIVEVLESRIKHGDYAIGVLPPERKLADELRVSHMTARKALLSLEESGILTREPNGRLAVNKKGNKKLKHMAFMVPAFFSRSFEVLKNAAILACAEKGIKLRTIQYTHWDDPVLLEALEAFDGLFLLPILQDMPEVLSGRFKNSKTPVVIVGNDYSEEGLLSVFPFQHVFIQRLLDYMAEQGHTRIDCFNTEPMSPIGRKGIEQWQIWMNARGYEGKLITNPVKSYEDAGTKAKNVLLEMIDNGSFDSPALLCTTGRSAMGAMRALYERNIKIGPDVAVAAMSGDGDAHLMCPSLTALEMGDPKPLIKTALDWMQGKWKGSFLLAPEDPVIVKGESTRKTQN